MTIINSIEDLTDPRLAPYHNLRNRNPIYTSGHFIVESKLLVQRLVDSSYDIESILVDAEESVDPSWLERSVPIYRTSDISQLIGFNFHRGALACGRRKPLGSALSNFEESLKARDASWQAVYLHQVQDPENMGSIFRTCAALGINRVIVGPSCVDPYARRVVRVSMGTSLKLTLLSDTAPQIFLQRMKEAAIPSAAATLSDRAVSIRSWTPKNDWVLLLGNEAHGLPESLLAKCSAHLTIPMKNGVDSLNVSNAAAIFLYVFAG